ncbi:hypothetical protein BGZ80_000721 [Entomortierella chlamydospora]|uniref:Uncharacterized protein n=1 Tax=Entomortierella chlamydospora TaxID=101097 RepID=A0A9P6SYA1_9FUNG|nr:hypothetical protein BGZ79_000729 [Entomortierella chlamydospora]KAG0011393.1 hypothetical protein BGZ80_000721 [Entomortierella chlamydospora]
MKSILALSAVLVAASASPLIEYSTEADKMLPSSPTGKQTIDGLSTPSAFASSLNTKSAPINYGNVNLGTGMMPSQIVHYGTEEHPDHAQIAPTLISSTAKEADFQVAKAERAGRLVNADVDIGKLNYAGPGLHKHMLTREEPFDEDEDKLSKWGWGWGWGYRGWGWGGWGWRRRYWY